MRVDFSEPGQHPVARRSTSRPDRSGRAPWRRLLSQLETLGGGTGILLRHTERAWASITFSGSRHTLAYTFTGAEAVEGGELLIATLPEHEFRLPGQLVADATVKAVDHRLTPEPRLTVEVELLVLDES